MIMKLDPLDVRIVGLLQHDARLSFREIAERLGSTTPTVSARVRALEDIGLLRSYRAHVDHSVFGGASYIVTLIFQPQFTREAYARVTTLPGVFSAHLLAGGRIVAHVHLRPPTQTLAALHETLAALDGLVTYEASEVLAGHEHPPVEELPENVEVPCHQCHGPIHGDPVKGKFADRTHVFCCRQCLGTFRERFESMAAKSTKPGASKGAPKGHAHP